MDAVLAGRRAGRPFTAGRSAGRPEGQPAAAGRPSRRLAYRPASQPAGRPTGAKIAPAKIAAMSRDWATASPMSRIAATAILYNAILTPYLQESSFAYLLHVIQYNLFVIY